jgi:5S rRNA maturation endonuclease (ribonuclease M5)
LSTHLEEKKERIEQILERLAEESANGTPIIVEGKKDTETLATFGIKGKIITAKTGGQSFLDIVSKIERNGIREVILLLDFDRRGRQGTARLKGHFEKARIKPNTRFWADLSALVGRQVKDVEGLVSYMETLKSKLSCNS